MGLIPEPVIEEVLARADILSTVQDYVSLKKSGANHKGLCPFHDENTPSFFVHPGKRIFKCFGCGVGGNVISFMMEIEGLGFPQAVRTLAERHGIEIPEDDPEAAERARKRREGKKLYGRIMDLTRQFYEAHLWGEQGAAARHYLDEREVDEQTARRFGLGYAPDGWQNLIDHLAGHGIDGRVVERAGLAMARNKSSGHYDRFRHRIIFPVVDVWEHTLAFGGRTLAANDDAPKYINSPETRFYTKGEQLYGLHAAKQAIQKQGYALLVEGNFDVICLHAKGFETAVAPMGTAVTPEQARLLERYCDRVVIAFDGDQAGEEATVRCLRALAGTKLEALVIRFDELEDPDTFVRRHGAGALSEKIDSAQPLVGWALDRVLTPVEGQNVERKLGALEEASVLLGQLTDRVTWEHYAQQIANRLAIDEHLLAEYLERPRQARKKVLEAHAPMELDATEYGLLVLLLDNPGWIAGFLDDELHNMLATEELVDLLERASDQFEEQGESFDSSTLLAAIDNRAFRNTVADALIDRDRLSQSKRVDREYHQLVRSLKIKWSTRTIDELNNQLDGLDFGSQRDEYEHVYRQIKEIEDFKAALLRPRDKL
jgi:DNA primase